MTLEEAIKVFGMSIIAIITKAEGHEAMSYYIFNAILEEWLDGNIDNISPEIIKELANKHGANIFKQTARIIANKVEIYGDVE